VAGDLMKWRLGHGVGIGKWSAGLVMEWRLGSGSQALEWFWMSLKIFFLCSCSEFIDKRHVVHRTWYCSKLYCYFLPALCGFVFEYFLSLRILFFFGTRGCSNDLPSFSEEQL
jgi:hypothetical protein